MQNRDFKGVWIPKEIWLNTELSITDKVLLAEIDSLDNENHCTASNEYFSEFFKVSVPTISRSIKKLKDLGFIETEMVNSNTGSYRIIKVIQGSNQNDETGLINLTTNYNSNNNKNTLSKDNVRTSAEQLEFNFGVSDEKSKKRTNNEEYLDACLLINNFTDDKELKKLLGELLDNRFEFAGKQRHHFYASTFKHYLDELSKVNDKIGAVKLSLQYNNILRVMEPNKPYNSVPDTNTAKQNRYSSDEDRISKMARNDDGTPMTF